MNGVGSFMNPSRTLFVGNLTRSKYISPKALEDAVWKHFSEWGEVENVNVVHRLSIAFPRFRLRTSAGLLSTFSTMGPYSCYCFAILSYFLRFGFMHLHLIFIPAFIILIPSDLLSVSLCI